MRNLKTVLPMLAFILAIGMSFAFVGATEENYATKYILLDPSDHSNPDSWAAIQIECGAGEEDCTIEYLPSEETFDVYNTPNLNDRAKSNVALVSIFETPPTID